MSGGSFNYLCLKDIQEISGETVEEMAQALEAAGAHDAAEETRDVIRRIVALDKWLESTGIRRVWHAMEWWKSGDSGRDRLEEALEKWRKDRAP